MNRLTNRVLKLAAVAAVCGAANAFAAVGDIGSWTYAYNSSAKAYLLTEVVESGTAWVLTVTVVNDEASVKVKTVGSSTVIDLRAENVDPSCPPIVEIPYQGFNGKNTITDLYLPDTLRTIGIQAFQSCSALTNVVPFLPASVTSIDKRAFMNAPVRNALVLSNPNLTSIPGEGGFGVFQGTKVPSADFSQSGITSLGSRLFSAVSTLGEVKFPPTLASIDTYAFISCTSLTNVVPFMPDSLTSIGNRAFYQCPIACPLRISNSNFTVLNSETASGQFQGSNIPSADFSGSGMTTIGSAAFRGCTTLTNVVMSSALTSVGSYALACNNLKDIYFTSLTRLADFSGITGVGGFNSRFRYPINAAESWDAGRTAKFKSWDDASITAANRQLYAETFADGTTPVGIDTLGGKQRCLVPVKDTSGKVNVLIVGDPVNAGTPDPDYGDLKDVGPTIVGSVPQLGVDGHQWYESTGYRIDSQDDEGHWVEGEVVRERTVSYTPDEGGNFRLTWFWDLRGHRIALNPYNRALGSVDVQPADYADEYYTKGTTVELRATALNGTTFERWYGDVPEGHEADNPLALPSDSERVVAPYFTKNWEIVNGGEWITDGEWALSVTANAGALTVTGVKTNGVIGVLDLRKPVNGGTIVGIGAAAFNGNLVLSEVRLPETLTTIGFQAFQSCSKLKTVIPFLPKSVTTIDGRAFTYSPIESPLVLLNKDLTEIVASAEYGMFRNGRMSTADLSKSGVRTVGGYSFMGCGNLVSISFPKTLEAIGGLAFDSNTALMDTAFRSCPTIASDAFRYCSGLPARITFPKGDAGWMQRIADAGTGFHPWSSATSAQSNDYFATFPARPVPLGYMSVGGVNRWLVPVNVGSGMKLVFR